MQCGKPIFAVSPKKGVLNDLYEKKNVRYYANVKDVDSIYSELCKLYDDFNNAQLSIKVNTPIEYEANYIVDQYKNF